MINHLPYNKGVLMDSWQEMMGLLMLACGFYGMFVAPVLFRFYIIPDIEKKTGHKIDFISPIYTLSPGATWHVKPVELGFGLVLLSLSRNSIWRFGRKNVIHTIKIRKEDCSLFEVVCGYLSVLNGIAILFSGALYCFF
jgi:hypothetical protein